MKSLFGGSAALATAFISAAVLFQASPSTAETTLRLQEPTRKQEQKPDAQINPNLPGSLALPAAALQTEEAAMTLMPDAAAASASLKVKTITEEPPAMSAVKGRELTTLVSAAPPQIFMATAYSFTGRTASGRPVAKGLIAADTSMLPIGTRVRLEAGTYSGEYLVADRGSAVRGRRIDVWVPSTREAFRFGRRPVKLTVLSYGGRKKAKA